MIEIGPANEKILLEEINSLAEKRVSSYKELSFNDKTIKADASYASYLRIICQTPFDEFFEIRFYAFFQNLYFDFRTVQKVSKEDMIISKYTPIGEQIISEKMSLGINETSDIEL